MTARTRRRRCTAVQDVRLGAPGVGVNFGLLWLTTSVPGVPAHAGWAASIFVFPAKAAVCLHATPASGAPGE